MISSLKLYINSIVESRNTNMIEDNDDEMRESVKSVTIPKIGSPRASSADFKDPKT